VLVRPLFRAVVGIMGAVLVGLGSWIIFVLHDQAIESPGFPLILAGWIGVVKAFTAKDSDESL
jgi:hypothetical protein